jgi:Ca2+-transporting ATPase
MLFKGTTVVEGRASGIAVATGMQTQLGRVSKMASEAQSTATPLQKKLDQLGRRLAVIVIVVAAGLAGLGYFVRQEDVLLIVETSIALGVAAIPEGLPIVATIALAWGMYAMAKRHALINHLPAVETLGATRIIFTDKTGTLTLNRMTIRRMVTTARDDELHIDSMKRGDELPDYPLLRHAIEIGVLCNNASLASDGGSDGKETDEKPRGDPMELALLEAGRAYGIDRHSLLDRKHELREVSFDPDEMKMATYHQSGEEILVAVKGAPEKLLEVCTRKAEPSEEAADRETELTAAERDFWGGVADDMAAAGLRVLGIADKTVRNADESPYENLRLIGLVGLVDPPREDVRQVINMTQAAGIRIVMVTGDQPRTAEAIAEAVGIVGDVDDPRAVVMHGSELSDPDELSEDERKQVHRTNIFARVSPEQKLDLIRTYQQSGEIVAMTGDGVNDAPALKKADIGVAMGRRGTDAARQVADMILTDDALASIVHAIERGRVTFVNIRKAAMFMLCTNVAEVIAVAVAFAAAWPVPIRPLQILYLNVLTDVLPAMALAVSPGAPDIMQHPPRDPKESVISTRHWLHVIGWGTIIAVCVLAALLTSLWWMQLPAVEAVTTSFLTLGLSKLWFTFILRRSGSNILSNEITANPWVWAAVALCLGLLIAAVYLPGLSGVLETTGPGARGWMLAIVLSLVPMVLGQVWLIGRPGLTASPGERH